MNYEREAVVLGALLHDIGKFVQRAQKNPKEKNHSKWGEEWFERYLSEKLQKIFGKEKDIIERAISDHHYHSSYVSLADYLSAGSERIELEDEEKDPFSVPLVSIFSNIFDCKEQYFYSLKKLENLGSIKPEKIVNLTFKNYENLLMEFNSELKEAYFKSPEDVFEVIYHLLLKYTWCIPSAIYRSEPDISLFEHLKTTAAFANCFYNLEKEGGDKEREFILLHSDISGIQNFIYSVTTQNALKGLRGRSFYLEILLEAIANLFLEEFELSLCNILFFGGGNFSLLLPNVKNSIDKIERISREIKEKTFKAHGTQLGVTISYLEISRNDISKVKYENTLQRLSEITAIEKKKKFKEILNYENIFKPYGGEEQMSGCEICGEEIEGVEKCKLCVSFEELAKELKKAKYLSIKKIEKKNIHKAQNWFDLINSFGFEFYFLEKKEERGRCYLINSTDFVKEKCAGFKFIPVLSPENMTLKEVAEKAKGMEKWGILRMDVDNLGNIFKKGLNIKSITRYNVLSQLLSLFFSLGVMEILKKENPYSCLVYSGGDDLFIISPWSDLPEISQRIYDNFKDFVCHNPEINLSGGIYIAPSDGFPVYEAAREAGSAEDKSKGLEGKNGITFLDVSLKWNEFKEIKKVYEDIFNLIQNDKIPRSLLGILYFGYEEEALLENKKISIPRIWRIFYGMRRLMERHRGSEDKLEKLLNIFIKDYKMSPQLNLAVAWADLITR